MRISLKLLLPILGAMAACSQTVPPREVTGHLDTKAFAVSRGAVVVGVSASNRLYTGSLTDRGGFHLSLPTSESYRLMLAIPTRKGYRALGRIEWLTVNGTSRWAFVKEGPGIRFSKIQPAASKKDDKDVEDDDDSDIAGTTPNDVDDGTACDADHWKGHHADGGDVDGDDDDHGGDRDGDHGHSDLVRFHASSADGEGSGESYGDCQGHDKDGHDKDGVDGDDDHHKRHKDHDDGDDVDCTVPAPDGGTGGFTDGGTGGNTDGGTTGGTTDGGTPGGGTGGQDAGPMCVMSGGSCMSASDCCVGLTCGSGFCTPILR